MVTMVDEEKRKKDMSSVLRVTTYILTHAGSRGKDIGITFNWIS